MDKHDNSHYICRLKTKFDLVYNQRLAVNIVNFLGCDSAGDEIELGTVYLHGGGELVAHFARNLAFAYEPFEHRGEIGGAFEAQECQNALDIFGILLFADFHVGREEVADGGAVRHTLVQREVVTHAVRYGGARVRDGHARDGRSEHEFFVKVFAYGRVGKERFLEFAPEPEAVFRAHAVERVGIDVQDAFDHVGERVDSGVHD